MTLTFLSLLCAALVPPAAALPFDPNRRYTRKQLAQVLTDLGFPTTRATLQTLVSRGGGPPFERYGRWSLYLGKTALAWAESRCRPVCSPNRERDDVVRNINP
jgi:hypothetical protein